MQVGKRDVEIDLKSVGREVDEGQLKFRALLDADIFWIGIDLCDCF